MTENTHSEMSPSGFERLMTCPASYKANKKYRGIEGVSNPASIDGTHSHTLLEYCGKERIHPTSTLGETFEDHEGDFTVAVDRAERVAVAFDYIASRFVELGEDQTEAYYEVKMDSDSAFGRNDMGGTADVILLSKNMMEVIDYKDGRKKVDVECAQLYICGILAIYHFFNRLNDLSVNTIRLTIVQPRLKTTDGLSNGISSIDIPLGELHERRNLYIAAAAACEEEDAPYVPSDLCRYCPSAENSSCIAFANHVFGKVNILFSATDIADQAAKKDASSLTNDQLREIILAGPLLRSLIEDAEKEEVRRLTSGQVIEGRKLVRGKGSRDWKYEDDKMATKLKKFGIPKTQIYKQTLVSPAQAEGISWKKADGSVSRLSKKQIDMLRKEYVVWSPGKIIAVDSDDKREEVGSKSCEEMFNSVESLPTWL